MSRTFKEILSEVTEYLNTSVLVGERITAKSLNEIKAKAKDGIQKFIQDNAMTVDDFATQEQLIKAIIDELREYGVLTDLLNNRKILEIQCLNPGTISYTQNLMNIHGIPYHGHGTVHDPHATPETCLRVIMKLLRGEPLTINNPIQVVNDEELGFIITAGHGDFTKTGEYALKLVRKR